MAICNSPGCENKTEYRVGDEYSFCSECRENHSLFVLKVQIEHEKPIKEVILDAKLFKSASGMSDYIGVSFVTLYNWIEKYFKDNKGKGLSFQEFRREYICRSTKCYVLNIERSSYSRSDYILKKIRSKCKCACINALAPDLIMTNAPFEDVGNILRGHPRIKKISDGVFALAPNPIKIRNVKAIKVWKQSPIHFPRHIFPIKIKHL